MKRILIILSAIVLFAFEANSQNGTWSGKLDVQGIKISLVFHLDGDSPTVDSPDQGVKGIPIQVERKSFGGIVINIPMLGASFEGVNVMQQIVGTFSQAGISLPLTLIPGDVKLNRPQTPQGSFPYTTEEVSFNNGELVLNGTLTLPDGYSNSSPAVVMVTGSGQQNRDEELFEHKPFAVIADALARAGIATLRYDDRGFNGYAGNIGECTTDDFKNDALAGVEFLRKRFGKVGVIGHSEGGTIALMLAAEHKVDYIVSLAGMVISGAETLILQNRSALAAAGFDKEVVDTYCKVLEEAFEVKVNGGSMPRIDNYELPDVLKQNFISVLTMIQQPYMHHFLTLDMRPQLNKVLCPVLALNGTKDIQVEYESNLGALRNGLSSNENSSTEAIEGVNHLFQTCKTGDVTEYREIEETISPKVLEIIADWILQIAK